ncbi:hypothetical protein SAMN04489718_3476 [Actinopolyspora saharensis]|uniref:Uncharacterized protein n=1 Tax=Actinopolyspora saharensis TaxID=995062 RepID=A0A1H1G844_9ACTN|nr:hypothetical protein SAMN04489718_3476 [Actinopolyspora saharensis]
MRRSDSSGRATRESTRANEGVSPDWVVTALALFVGWYLTARYVGDNYGWYWPWVLLVLCLLVLFGRRRRSKRSSRRGPEHERPSARRERADERRTSQGTPPVTDGGRDRRRCTHAASEGSPAGVRVSRDSLRSTTTAAAKNASATSRPIEPLPVSPRAK